MHGAVTVEESTKDETEKAVSFFNIITQSVDCAEYPGLEDSSGHKDSEDEDTNDPAGMDMMEVKTQDVRGHVDWDIKLNCLVEREPRDMDTRNCT